MKIGFIGLGVVGEATLHLCLRHGHKDFITHDPPKQLEGDVKDCEVIFVAVPVPTKSNGEQDTELLLDVLSKTTREQKIFIRSTVLPKTTRNLRANLWNKNVYALPEFLTQRIASQDVMKLPLVASHEGALILKDIFPGKEILQLESEEACEYVKYMHNSFCAVSVGFFNLMHAFAKSRGLNYNDAILAASEVTGFVPRTHAKVPGPDGSLGFGGKCLPKDLYAFATILEKELKRSTFLREVINDNFKNRFEDLF